jgi:hypothetical protein
MPAKKKPENIKKKNLEALKKYREEIKSLLYGDDMPEPKNKKPKPKPKKPKKKPDIDLSKRKLYDKPDPRGGWSKPDPWEGWPFMKKKKRNPSGEQKELANSLKRLTKSGHGQTEKELDRMDMIDEGKSTLRLAKTAQDTSDVRTLRDRGFGEEEIFKSFESIWLRKRREKLDKEMKRRRKEGKSNQKKT